VDSHTYKIMKSPGDGRGVGEISLNLGGDIFGVGGGGCILYQQVNAMNQNNLN